MWVVLSSYKVATENGGVGGMMMWDWEGGGIVVVLWIHVATRSSSKY